jgi:hypothetical protein
VRRWLGAACRCCIELRAGEIGGFGVLFGQSRIVHETGLGKLEIISRHRDEYGFGVTIWANIDSNV